MYGKETVVNENLEIDLSRIFAAVVKKGRLIGVVVAVCGLMVLVMTLLFVTPRYQSSVMFYVNNNTLSSGGTAQSITSSDISASRGLVQSYIVILNTRETLTEVIGYAGVDRTCRDLEKMITAEAVDSTEIFEVIVTGPDAGEAEQIADAIAYVLPNRIAGIIEGSSAKIVDSAVSSSRPSSPNYVINTLVGFLVGLILAVGAVALEVLLDVTIRREEDVEQNCSYPILTAIPNMEQLLRDENEISDSIALDAGDQTPGKPAVFGSGIGFVAEEGYKLLRTKLQFSFADDNDSRIVGISSALNGEGKTLSAINLAFSMSQLGKKVLLIDCDMRRTTVAEKLGIQKKFGLSNFLTGQSSLDELIQCCGAPNDLNGFYVITAGPNPPNPMELLSSARMKRMLESLRNLFDYIILDLPPVGEVSDALAVAKDADGMLLVVRQDTCDRTALQDAIHQFEFIDAKLLGIIYNGTTEPRGKYARDFHRRTRQKTGWQPRAKKLAASLKIPRKQN